MSDGIVLLHGIARTSAGMRPLQRALETAGYAVLNLDYPSRRLPLDALADFVLPAMRHFAQASPGSVHIVAHSMGGLLARVALARHRPARLGRVVMLGTPNAGSEVADRLRHFAAYRMVLGPAGQDLVTTPDKTLRAALGIVDYPLGIIAGNKPLVPFVSDLILPLPNDGKVTVASTKLHGMAAHLVLPTSHTRLIRNPAAIAATLAFLRHGAFE